MTETAESAPAFPLRLVLRAALMVAVIAALLSYAAPAWQAVLDWRLNDNDDAMRVLSVRDWLAGQAWFDPRQHRLNPPDSGDMHWSRIADLPLAAFMAPLSALFGQSPGEQMAAFAAPLALLLVFAAIGVRAATMLGGPGAFVPAIIFIIAAPATTAYFTPGRVDHHGLQMIFLVGAYAGLLTDGRKGAALAAVCIALSLAVGLETAPLLLGLIGWVSVRWWWRGDAAREATMAFGLTLALATPVLFALTVPSERWSAPVSDAIGRGHVAACVAGGLLLALAVRLCPGRGLWTRFGALACVGVLCLPIVLGFGELRVHPYDQVDPLLVKLWLNNVSETAPYIRSRPGTTLTFAVFPVLAALAALAGAVLSQGPRRDHWLLALLMVVVAGALTLFWQGRVAGQATAIASIAAAAAAALVWSRFGPTAAIGLALVANPVVPGAIGGAVHKLIEPKQQRYATGGGSGCYGLKAFATLAAQPKGLVIAPVDMGARVLLGTHHSVMAAPYHRNNRGNLLAYRSFLLEPEAARTHLLAMGASYVAICDKSAENGILSREAPKGLMSGLKDGKAPAWLVPVPSPKGSDVKVWRVTAQAAPSGRSPSATTVSTPSDPT